MLRKVLSVLAIVGIMCSPLLAGVKPGDEAPEFQLFGVDYSYHALEDYADNEGVVVVFTCNHCPVAKRYEDRLIEPGEEYQERGFQFLAVNPNPADMVEEDGFPQMQERAEEKGFPYPYLYDETQEVARAYGAKVTPHIFVVEYQGDGEERKPVIRYQGAMDNRGDEPEYLADALDAIPADENIAEERWFRGGAAC